MTFWTLVRFLHVGSAILWVGGQLTPSLILRPIAGRMLDTGTRRGLTTAIGRRFGRIRSFGLIPLLPATGLALSYHHGVELGGLSLTFPATTLTFKIVLALVSFGLAMAHGIVAARSSSSMVWVVGVTSTVVSVLVVLVAVMLVA